MRKNDIMLLGGAERYMQCDQTYVRYGSFGSDASVILNVTLLPEGLGAAGAAALRTESEMKNLCISDADRELMYAGEGGRRTAETCARRGFGAVGMEPASGGGRAQAEGTTVNVPLRRRRRGRGGGGLVPRNSLHNSTNSTQWQAPTCKVRLQGLFLFWMHHQQFLCSNFSLWK
jgi:hypothetical protein